MKNYILSLSSNLTNKSEINKINISNNAKRKFNQTKLIFNSNTVNLYNSYKLTETKENPNKINSSLNVVKNTDNSLVKNINNNNNKTETSLTDNQDCISNNEIKVCMTTTNSNSHSLNKSNNIKKSCAFKFNNTKYSTENKSLNSSLRKENSITSKVSSKSQQNNKKNTILTKTTYIKNYEDLKKISYQKLLNKRIGNLNSRKVTSTSLSIKNDIKDNKEIVSEVKKESTIVNSDKPIETKIENNIKETKLSPFFSNNTTIINIYNTNIHKSTSEKNKNYSIQEDNENKVSSANLNINNTNFNTISSKNINTKLNLNSNKKQPSKQVTQSKPNQLSTKPLQVKLNSNLDFKQNIKNSIMSIKPGIKAALNSKNKKDRTSSMDKIVSDNKKTILTERIINKPAYLSIKKERKSSVDNTKPSFDSNKNQMTSLPVNKSIIINKISDKQLLKSASIIDLEIDSNLLDNINSSKGKVINKVFQNKVISKIHQVTKTGISTQKKVNQDNYFIFEDFEEKAEYLFLGVCDGHGLNGHLISQTISDNLPKILNDSILSKRLKLLIDNKKNSHLKTTEISSIEYNKIIENSFLLMNDFISQSFGNKCDLSGSTCVSLIYSPDKIITANVGDSRCVMGKCFNGIWTAQNLTRDHKPSEADELERIKNYGGRVEAMKDENNNYIGPQRVWLKDTNTLGLGMSRSFGDKIGSNVGVISNPEIMEWFLTEEDKFIILATDGVWEYMDSLEVISIIKKHYYSGDIKSAAEEIVMTSSAKWKQKEGVVDDITLILIFFE